jgi:hypothetical protein
LDGLCGKKGRQVDEKKNRSKKMIIVGQRKKKRGKHRLLHWTFQILFLLKLCLLRRKNKIKIILESQSRFFPATLSLSEKKTHTTTTLPMSMIPSKNDQTISILREEILTPRLSDRIAIRITLRKIGPKNLKEFRDANGNSLLHLCRWAPLTQELIDSAELDPNCKNAFGIPPLFMHPALPEDVKAVLMSRGADMILW